MASNKYCVIMAGGIGSRFWPKSRRRCQNSSSTSWEPENRLSAIPTSAFGKNSAPAGISRRDEPQIQGSGVAAYPRNRGETGALRADRPQYGPLHRLCGLYAAQGEPRCRDDRHAVGSPDPQRGRFPHDHRRMPRVRRPARRPADRGHQNPRAPTRATATFRSRTTTPSARSSASPKNPTSSWRRPSFRPASSTGIRGSSSGRCRPSSKPSANTCPSTMPCSAA